MFSTLSITVIIDVNALQKVGFTYSKTKNSIFHSLKIQSFFYFLSHKKSFKYYFEAYLLFVLKVGIEPTRDLSLTGF